MSFEDEEDGLMDVMEAMNGAPLPRRPSDELPMPADAELTSQQMQVLNLLPEEPGHYWIENDGDEAMSVAWIDRSSRRRTVDHWGSRMDASASGMAAIERWINNHTVHNKVAAPVRQFETDTNETFGMF